MADGSLRFRPHPISDLAYWQAVDQSPVGRALAAEARRAAAELPPRPPVPAASDILAARRSNDRARLDRHWRGDRRDLAALIVARCLDGPDALDDRLLDWLWAMLTEATWAVSAHLPGQDLPRTDQPTLDLAACDMAAFVAEAREVLKPWMGAASNTLADTIVAEIDRRVLDPFVSHRDPWWIEDTGRINNWIGVCAGSILAACESLAAQGHPRPEARQKAIACLRRFFDEAFTASGECDEGVSYWSYGVGMACLGLMRLEPSELAQSMDMQRMRKVADYPRRCHLFDDCFFSGNDAGLRARAPRYFVPWLARAMELPWLTAWAQRSPADEFWHLGQWLRALDAATDAPTAASAEAAAAESGFLPDQQVLIARHSTGRGPLIICLSGGHNGERHNHNDLGHFIVALDGRIIVPDLGAPHYQADFFGPLRYERYLTASSRGHCCPIIAGQAQQAGADAAGKVLELSLDPPRLKLDLTAAYAPASGLKRWVRSLHAMSIVDEFRMAPNAPIAQVIWLLHRPQTKGAQLLLAPGLSLRLSPSPDRLTVEEHDPASHLMRDFADQMLYRVEALYVTDESGALRTEFEFSVDDTARL
jgi:hypothetical protein